MVSFEIKHSTLSCARGIIYSNEINMLIMGANGDWINYKLLYVGEDRRRV